MKENRTVTYTFTSKDYELLHKILPDDPCIPCIDSGSCCGCLENDNYRMATKLYRDNGIYELAFELKSTHDSLENILNCLNHFFEGIDNLKEYCKCVDKNNSDMITLCGVNILENKTYISSNYGKEHTDTNLFCFFLDSLGLSVNQYKMLEKFMNLLNNTETNSNTETDTNKE